jgi:hypothetical protein
MVAVAVRASPHTVLSRQMHPGYVLELYIVFVLFRSYLIAGLSYFVHSQFAVYRSRQYHESHFHVLRISPAFPSSSLEGFVCASQTHA